MTISREKEIEITELHEDRLIINWREASTRSGKSFFYMLIFSSLFVLISSGSTGEVKLMGSSIENPKSILWVLALIAAYHYMTCLYLFSFCEQLWRQLSILDFSRTNDGKPLQFGFSRAFHLLSPPSIFSLPFTDAIPSVSQKEEDDDFAFGFWIIIIVVLIPIFFFTWSIYTIIFGSEDSLINFIPGILIGTIVWNGLMKFWRSFNKH